MFKIESIHFYSLLESSNNKNINIILKKFFKEPINEIEMINFFNPILISYNEENINNFLKFPISLIEIPSKNLTLIGSTFIHQKEEKKKFITFFIGFLTNFYEKIKLFYDNIIENITGISVFISILYKNNQPIEIPDDFFFTTFEILEFFNKFIPICQNNSKIELNDLQFYSIVLSSHFETQMTTVIEFDKNNEEEKIKLNNLIIFLSYFTLPYCLNLSNLNILDYPISGFFIQIIKPQKSIPLEQLGLFSRTWTYINLKKKQIFQSYDFENHKKTKNYLKHYIYQPKTSNLLKEISKKKKEILSLYKICQINQSLSWSLELLNLIKQQKLEKKKIFCKNCFNNLINDSICLIKISESISTSKHQNFLDHEQVKELCQILLINEDKLKSLVGISTLFDSRIYNIIYTGCQEVLKKMLHAV